MASFLYFLISKKRGKGKKRGRNVERGGERKKLTVILQSVHWILTKKKNREGRRLLVVSERGKRKGDTSLFSYFINRIGCKRKGGKKRRTRVTCRKKGGHLRSSSQQNFAHNWMGKREKGRMGDNRWEGKRRRGRTGEGKLSIFSPTFATKAKENTGKGRREREEIIEEVPRSKKEKKKKRDGRTRFT